MNHNSSQLEHINVTALSDDGRGIAHIDGKITFIKDAIPGDIVDINLIEEHKNYNDAQLTTLLSASKDRQQPFCPVFAQCGGCQLQHLKMDKQREYKVENFINRLRQALNFSKCKLSPAIIGKDQNYRRRARLGLAISKTDKQARLGFRRADSNELIDIEQCPVLTEALNKTLQKNRQSWLSHASRSYKEITLVEADNGVFSHISQNQKTLEDLSENPAQTPYYELMGLQLNFPADGFVQVNQNINQQMVEQAIDWLELKAEHKVLDLFCGVGNFTLPIAKHCQTVTGIEGVIELVQTAADNARHNQLDNCRFAKANLFEDNRKAEWFRKQRYDRILLDPGRQGAFEISKQLQLLKADIIVYVSCNAATLIRDVKELEKHGYQLHKASLIDMFPHTHHTEVMVQLKKGKKPQKNNKKVFRF
ncbi:23S rRNA (uracil(1939)-C(5))-methyltransferase RlmD [Thiomicrorhabdus sediminis]|uniref:23S rRNA (Uracil(1939)-C(5))-methyltransferase RlmD n=1 Tax=Thiomicrorhabdus sediminis TaxID=2580412 RepID=A0A4P9K487_9GAMM|nr:23S rRNA (uracil(1939)-C(5))-methyltransferase RlmD [Thiomicrorhabdus sediminis]QCU89739.1 23S rRNA (uracil(1939)-C(5))-methyltransferase RlmD [Thiomicrorhabdus sediminis]